MSSIRLPNAPTSYDREDQDRLRRAIEDAFEGFTLDLTGGGSGVLDVKSGDVAFAIGIAVIDWASADFTLTHSPVGELNVAISTGISRVGHVHDAADVTTGIFVRARLPAEVAYEDEANTFSLAQTFTLAAAFNAVGAPFTVASTTKVTNLNADLLDDQSSAFYQNATNLNAGTVARARLPAQVAYEDEANVFTQGQIFEDAVSIGDGTSGGGAVLNLMPGTTADHTYMQFFGDSASPTTRFAWMGYGSAGTDIFTLHQQRNERIRFATNDTARWEMLAAGHLVAVTDNTIDIGAAAATRPRTGYFGTSLVIGPDGGLGGIVRIGHATGTGLDFTAGGRADIRFSDTTQAADEKRFEISVGGVGGPKTFAFLTRTDAGGAGVQWLRAIRGTGTAIDNVEVAGTGFRTTSGTTLGDSGNRWGKLWGTDADFSATALIAGDVTLGARLIVSTAAGKILMGTSSLTIRNSTDSASIVSISASGGVNVFGTTAELALNPRSGGGASWELYAPTTASYRLYHTGDQYIFTDTEFTQAGTAKTLGTSGVRWGKLWGADADFTNTTVTVLIAGSTNGATLNLSGQAANQRDFNFQTNGVSRWTFRAVNDAESGGNVGSSFLMVARDDAGVAIDSPISIARAAGGIMDLARPVRMAAGLTVTAGDIRFDGHTAWGQTPQTDRIIDVRLTHLGTQTIKYGIVSREAFNSSTTSTAVGVYSRVDTAVAAFTVNMGAAYYVANAQLGAGSAITTQYGIFMDALTSGGTNYAIWTNGAGRIRFGDDLVFGGATAKIIPGVTSFSHRNNADSADNLLIADNGDLTGRTKFTMPGPLVLTTAASKIVPGATSLALRNNADNANNILISDAGVVTLRNDLTISSLGTFDSADTPTDMQLLVYHAGSVNKWQAESIQFVRGSGDFKAALLADNTAAAYVLLDPGAGADSPVGAPGATGAITVETGHLAFTLSIPAYTKPADFRYFEWQYCTGASCAGFGALVNSTSRSMVHSRLTSGTVYRYRVRAVDRAGNASAYATTGDNTAAAQSDVQAFGGVIAGEIATVDLTALAGDIGILITGQMRGSGNTYGINFGGVGGIPAGWVAGINFENTSLGSMTTYINFHNGGAASGSFIKHARGQWDYDGTVLMYQTSAQPLFKLNSTDFLLQNDAASPTQGILIDGSLPGTWTRYLNLNGSGSMLMHERLDLKYDGTALFKGRLELELTASSGFGNANILMRSSNVAHGVTDYVATDIFGSTGSISDTEGGVYLAGITETKHAILLTAIYTTSTTVESDGTPPLMFLIAKKSGTGTTAPAAADILLQVQAKDIGNVVTVFGDGDVHSLASFRASAGSNGTPAFSTRLDDNTGIYFPTSDEVGITVGGTQVARFASLLLDVTGKAQSYLGGSTTKNRVTHAPFTAANKTSTSTADVSLASFSLPANSLDRDGAGLRIRAHFNSTSASGARFRVVFGATNVWDVSTTGTGGGWVTIDIIRRASSSQRGSAFGWDVTNTVGIQSSSPAENQTGAITVDFRVDQVGAGTATLQTASLIYLDPDSTSVA